jgi:hypothetical protein
VINSAEIIDHLATAMGGRSQVPDYIIGLAIAGQMNNACPWPKPPGKARNLIDGRSVIQQKKWQEAEWNVVILGEGARSVA